jgi:hypothetical protein
LSEDPKRLIRDRIALQIAVRGDRENCLISVRGFEYSDIYDKRARKSLLQSATLITKNMPFAITNRWAMVDAVVQQKNGTSEARLK